METQLFHPGDPLILALPPTSAPAWPALDPNVFDCDAWHPADHQRPTFAGYAAAPTLCRVQWLAFDPNTPAGSETEDTWASVDEAYWMLPNPLAGRPYNAQTVDLTGTCSAFAHRERETRLACRTVKADFQIRRIPLMTP